MRPLLAALALLAMFSLAPACGSDDDTKPTVCTAGKVEACPCPGGAQGSQACKGDGSGFDACSCPGGAGGAGGAGSPGTAAGGNAFPGLAGSSGVGGLSTSLDGCTRLRYCCGLLPTDSGRFCLSNADSIEKGSADPSSACNDHIAGYQNAGYCKP